MKRGILSGLVFLVMEIRKNIKFVSKKCCEDKYIDLLLIEGRGRKHYFPSKDFNTFMYDYTLHLRKKTFLSLLFTRFKTADVLKCHVDDCFKINGKQMIKMSKKSEYVRFKTYEGKIKPLFMIYADFESILVRQDNGKQNPNESYTNNYQKHIACSYCCKLVCVDDKLSKPFKSYVGEDPRYNFVNSMIEESKCCSDVMKKHFNKELAMTAENNKDFKNSSQCWICDNDYVDNDAKVRDHFHINGKYRGSAHRGCNIKLKLKQKVKLSYSTT